ncbi:MAG: C39 family peptidase [Anaerolineaceae bacterium]
MQNPKLNKILMVLMIAIASSALLLAIYFLPPVHSRLSWRLSLLRAEIYYFFNPPDEMVFIPGQKEEMSAMELTPTATEAPPTETVEPSATPTNFVSPTPTETQTPTPTATPIPSAVELEGFVYDKQLFNNCGPANLSVALSFWGWDGDQTDIAAVVRPNSKDRNVMPYEMVEFVRVHTHLNAVVRYGGDLEVIKRFIAAGFPVLIERGYYEEITEFGWMGHYNVITGYDDNREVFTVQDTYPGIPNATYSFERIERHWQAFNYIYIITYPPEQEARVLELLGPQADEAYNLQYAAEKARAEIDFLSGRELFFGWHNYGSSLANLGDYYGAAQAFDTAFEVYEEIYPRPYRLFWYSTGAYYAYYYTGRYQDVINLADAVLGLSAEPAIEETWVWRGRARLALGNTNGAIEDFRTALKWHPGWWVANNELQSLGIWD